MLFIFYIRRNKVFDFISSFLTRFRPYFYFEYKQTFVVIYIVKERRQKQNGIANKKMLHVVTNKIKVKNVK